MLSKAGDPLERLTAVVFDAFGYRLEKASDLIRSVQKLPPANAPFYRSSDWRAKQR